MGRREQLAGGGAGLFQFGTGCCDSFRSDGLRAGGGGDMRGYLEALARLPPVRTCAEEGSNGDAWQSTSIRW